MRLCKNKVPSCFSYVPLRKIYVPSCSFYVPSCFSYVPLGKIYVPGCFL